MAVDTFVAYGGVYSDLAHAEADYELVKGLHAQAGLLDAYDAAVIHGAPTARSRSSSSTRRRPGRRGPGRREGGAGGGRDLGHGARIEQAMQHADKLQTKELKADTAEIERDAKAAGADQAPAND
jgi:hypothetical protein